MPWQQYVVDVILEIDPDTGRLAYQEWGLTVPRQSGKSTLVLAKSTHRASATKFFGPRQRLVYTAQTRAKAREKWEEDFVADLEASIFKSRIAVHKGNGQEHIRFQNGSRFGIDANTEKAGHGGTLDEAYIDEAFAQVDFRLEQAFGPAMITRINKQLGWVSTAGWLDASPYLAAKMTVGRAATAADRGSGLAYFDWCAGEDDDPGDPATWWACMPALGWTITEEAIRLEYEKALTAGKLNDFKRAYLNLWVPKEAEEAPAITAAAWRALEDATSVAASVSAFGVEVSLDRAFSAIAVGGPRGDGRVHVELLPTRRGGEEFISRGAGWVVARCVELDAAQGPAVWAVDGGGEAAGLVPELEAAGLNVVVMNTADVAAASSGLVEAVRDGKLSPHGPRPELVAAVEGAKKRPLNDGKFALGRRVSTGDITALLAVRNAHWATDLGYDVLDSIF